MSRRHLVGGVVAACTVLLVASCSQTLEGKPVSVFDDPFQVAGMRAVDGDTGLRPDAKESSREVTNSDGGDIVLTGQHKLVLGLFAVALVVMIYGVIPWEDLGIGLPTLWWWFPEMTASFLFFAILAFFLAGAFGRIL